MRVTLTLVALFIAACSSASSTSSTSSSSSSSGDAPSGTAPSAPAPCPPDPRGTQSTTLTACSTTELSIAWQPPNLTTEVCGSPTGASITFIAAGLCGLGAVTTPSGAPSGSAHAGSSSVELIEGAAYRVQTSDGRRFTLWVEGSRPEGLAIDWFEGAQSF